MKRLLALIMTVAMLMTSFTFISSGATSSGNYGFMPGDANDDVEVNMKDVLLIRRYIAGLDPEKSIDSLAADVVADSSVDMKDVLKLRRVIAGLESLSDPNEDGRYKVSVAAIGGKNLSRFSILIPSDADECIKYSANRLKYYVTRSCGITLNIVNSRSAVDTYFIEYKLDKDDEYSLGTEGYHVKVEDGGDLVLTCGSLRGALYGTYYLLEKYMGWRFLNDDVTYLYASDLVDLPVGYEDVEVPVFEYRGLNQIGSTTTDFAWLRLNAVDAKGSGSAASYTYGGGVGNLYIHGHSYAYQYAVGTNLDEAGITDLDSPEASRIFQTYGYNTPELDALNLHVTQPCLTSDETFRYIMSFNYLLYKERTLDGRLVPGIHYTMLSCSPNDNTDFCTCENCKAVYAEEGSIAGTVFRMSNRVAEAQRELMPGVGVYTIAYWDARNPPKYTRPEDDVCVCFCFGGCNNHTYDHVEECQAAGGNPRYPARVWDTKTQRVVDADYDISNVQDIDFYKKWAELTNNLYVWYYACNFAYYIAPCPNVLNIYNDYKYLASTGTIGIYTEGSTLGYTFEVLRGYLAARMMWDPMMSEEEFEAYLDEFLMIYYGDGWKYIKEYIYMQDICGNLQGCFVNNFDRPWNFYNKDYYRENFDYMLDLFNKAYDATTSSTQKDRIEKARIHVYFLGLSATYESKWVNGSASEKSAYKEKYDYLWNYVNGGDFQCVDIGASGKGGLGNFPKTSDDVIDTMFWIQDGFYGDGR